MFETTRRRQGRRSLSLLASGALVAGTALTATALGAGTAHAADFDENFNYDCDTVAAGLPLGIHDVGVRAQVSVPDEVEPGEVIPTRKTQITLTLPETLRNATYVLLSARQAGGYSDDASISITAEGVPDPLVYPIENLSAPFSPVPPNVGDPWLIPTEGDVPPITVPSQAEYPDIVLPTDAVIHMPGAFTITASLLNASGGLIGGEGAVTMDCTITSESDVFGAIPIVEGNTAPTAGDVAASTDEDTPVDITLDGADADGDDLTYSYTQPSNGSVSGDGPDVTYTPDPDFFGEDSFEYTVDDGNGGTATGTVTVTVADVADNTPPTAGDVSASTDENTPVDITLDGADADGDELTYSYTQPANGSVSGDGPDVTYTPAADFDGEDSFEYTVDDGNGGTATGTVTVTVNDVAVNTPPTAGDVSVSTDENTPVDITLDGADADGDELTYSYTQPANGSVSGDGPDVTYTPAADFDGEDSFEYTVDDGNGGTATGTVTVTVSDVAVNTPPTANDVAASTEQDTAVDVTLDGADADGDALTYSYTQPSNGSVSGDGPDVTYTPAAGFFGEDSFEYTVDDGNGGTATGTVTVTVTEVVVENTPPTAGDVAASTDEGVAVDVTLDGADADGDDLTYSYEQPANGSVSGDGPDVTYTPAAGFSGEDTFTYTVSDGQAEATGTVTVTVNEVVVENTPPTAGDVSASTDEGVAVDVTLDGADADGDDLTYTYSQPSNGSVSGDGPDVTYTPAADFTGEDTFTYTVSDGQAEATGTVTVTVDEVTEPPADKCGPKPGKHASIWTWLKWIACKLWECLGHGPKFGLR
ncbi:hypothetical protein CLV56_2653 [Mumia flava]|uniref:Cadherin domain-containing protein n=1 Tax=Mumia flava TaxID=1348852 RepID=A0A2M9BKC5_9ACTN|nr:Ig-like domain-containing protein [Mumia flava]PJJ58402.1 hypothetical protein CLV56_2653 [Mumia flava]